jgi:hypothetical protein
MVLGNLYLPTLLSFIFCQSILKAFKMPHMQFSNMWVVFFSNTPSVLLYLMF